MTVDDFLETRTLTVKDPMEGYIIPYAYLKFLLEEYARIKVDEVSESDTNNSPINSCNECGRPLDNGTVFCSTDCRQHYHY